jgi:hypothetical protein
VAIEYDDDEPLEDYTENLVGNSVDASRRKFNKYKNSISSKASAISEEDANKLVEAYKNGGNGIKKAKAWAGRRKKAWEETKQEAREVYEESGAKAFVEKGVKPAYRKAEKYGKLTKKELDTMKKLQRGEEIEGITFKVVNGKKVPLRPGAFWGEKAGKKGTGRTLPRMPKVRAAGASPTAKFAKFRPSTPGVAFPHPPGKGSTRGKLVTMGGGGLRPTLTHQIGPGVTTDIRRANVDLSVRASPEFKPVLQTFVTPGQKASPAVKGWHTQFSLTKQSVAGLNLAPVKGIKLDEVLVKKKPKKNGNKKKRTRPGIIDIDIPGFNI